MAKRYVDIPDYHGDGDSTIELHHGEPSYWTKKMTMWSVAMVILFVLFAAAIFAIML